LHPEANKVCAVVVTYHIGPRIFACIDSIAGQVGGVIVVDNGSGNETLDALRELEARPHFHVIYNARNLGIAGALNQGVQLALQQGYRWILTLDHDSEATPGMVEKLLQTYDTLGEQVGIVAANPFDRNTRAFLRRDIGQDTPYVIANGCVMSSGSLIDVAVFPKVGFFDEMLFQYFVDDDFCIRVRRSGRKTVVCCGATLLHSEGSKVSKQFRGRSIFYDRQGKEAKYYIARNGVYMALKYRRDTSLGYWHLKRVMADFVKIFLYDEQPLPKASYVLKGLWDGIRGRYGGLDSPRHVRQAH
jgi:rhamnosyltransferase